MSTDTNIVILSAQKQIGKTHSPILFEVGNHKSIFDWQEDAFSVIKEKKFEVIGGYHFKEMFDKFQKKNISLTFNPHWETDHTVGSLLCSKKICEGSMFVSYADIIYRQDIIEEIERIQADVVVAIDGQWESRFESRGILDKTYAEKIIIQNIEDKERIEKAFSGNYENLGIHFKVYEFIGLLKLSVRAQVYLKKEFEKKNLLRTDNLVKLINLLNESDLSISVFDVENNWAELNYPQDLAKFILGTKAETLERIKPLLKNSKIAPLCRFTYKEWRENRKQVIEKIIRFFQGGQIVIRSSALNEDCWEKSMAGQFCSLLKIDSSDYVEIESSLKEVFNSYSDQVGENQILVQEMLNNIICSGVIMTRLPADGSPYIVINYDDETEDTTSVTAGLHGRLKTAYFYRGQQEDWVYPAYYFEKLLVSILEIENLVGHESLGIEFSVCGDKTDYCIYVLQVRPIVFSCGITSVDKKTLDSCLVSAKEAIKSIDKGRPQLLGEGNILSIMTDWNPAEIIGTRPRSLAYSLYEHLITNSIWAKQRSEYGYRDVNPCPLLVNICGHPYDVDVKASFNSFVPKNIETKTAEKLINYYLRKLKGNVDLYDKAEFEILFTHFPLSVDIFEEKLLAENFKRSEILEILAGLKEVTRTGLLSLEQQIEKIGKLSSKIFAIKECELSSIYKVNLFLETVKEFGTLPFSHLARSAFIATSIINELVKMELLTEGEAASFFTAIPMVSTKLQADAYKVKVGEMGWSKFKEQYGHLRPGTYEITSDNYKSEEKLYLWPIVDHSKNIAQKDELSLNAETMKRLGQYLQEIKVSGWSNDQLVSWLAQSISGREHAKLIFTKGLNFALEEIEQMGNSLNISREDMANLHVNDILAGQYIYDDDSLSKHFKKIIKSRKKLFEVTQSLNFPPVITTIQDVYSFTLGSISPNFITNKKITADILVIGCGKALDDLNLLKGRLIVIENAGPGYDWIFSHDIAGLITMYGGVNSHMAVRANEFQLPAAIGIGETLYERLIQSIRAEMNCESRELICLV